ncbi:D-alanine--D-serine ligase VanG [Oscillibacter sp. MSJ-2]|uniref:D-alanine--D-alanine ligase n=1 Tax=Dysosmobacter acutus TaxID=2841504 RepID=A0ABS6F5I6_9FIRM|nr:D-alanine--D-serine ligase VanG [Dysosmobacter acutus]MBU5625536.1 D-alanine--D-serine ligase VanG [Dysosmobacter acutus]
MTQKTILVLFGGCSDEYGVSLQSAYAVLTHMDPRRYRPLAVGITRDGTWLLYTGPLEALPEDSWQEDRSSCIPCTLRLDRHSHALLLLDGSARALSFDLAFPVLHGKNGEDGTVQGIFELSGVPLVGCGTLSSALCMDKDRSHKIAALAGVRVPRSAVFDCGAQLPAIRQAASGLGYPLFIKPVRAGSSYGVTRVEEPGQLGLAAAQAFSHDSQILMEEAVPGFEVGVAVLGNRELTVGLVDEIELSQGFFNFEEKYTLKTSAIHCPARISAQKAAELQETARRIYRALGCRVFARVDLFLTPQGEIVFNEVNTIPGFTAHSRYPTMMGGIGLSFTDLVSRLIELGVER